MRTFEEFVAEVATGNGVNLIFEAGMYSLSNDLEQLVQALQGAGIHFELVSGVAVNAHIYLKNRSRSFVTRDIDVLVHRQDLQNIAQATEPLGYAPKKKMLGGYTLIRQDQDLGGAIHLLFVGEQSKSTQLVAHPEIHPEDKHLLNLTIPVAPLRDLLIMTLSSFGPKDIIHIETLDEVGLITKELEQQLPAVLKQRLKDARKQIGDSKPDMEQ